MSLSNGPNIPRLHRLAHWASKLAFEDLPPDVVERTKELFLDTIGCTVAGRAHPAITAIASLARKMGPSDGPCEVIPFPRLKTSPAFAALVNGACSHVVEQDDLHNSSMMHPVCIFSDSFTLAQDVNANGKEFLTACVIGYEFACRTGEFLGRTHYKNFHTTATAGVIGAAAASCHLLKLDAVTLVSAVGTAGTQAAGLWQFLLDAAHSKQVHTGHACFNGVCSAYLAQAGLLGPNDILEGAKGMASSLAGSDIDPAAIDSKLGSKYAVLNSSFKWHASCRHTHPSVDALLKLMERTELKFEDIEAITARTYQAAINILGLTENPKTVHQSKFSMGFVLAVAAKNGKATISDFNEAALNDKSLRDFQNRVTMVLDPAIDGLFPARWTGAIEVVTKSGERLFEAVGSVKGDPELTLTREELQRKTRDMMEYGTVLDMDQLQSITRRIGNLEKESSMLGYTFD